MEENLYSYKYPHAALTADSVVFGFEGKDLYVLLVERGGEPYKGSWAVPGGFMNIDETVEDCAARELLEETGLEALYKEEYAVFSTVHRDPRERVITVGYFSLVRKSECHAKAGDDAAKVGWFDIRKLPPLAFDHDLVIQKALDRLLEKWYLKAVTGKFMDGKYSVEELEEISVFQK